MDNLEVIGLDQDIFNLPNHINVTTESVPTISCKANITKNKKPKKFQQEWLLIPEFDGWLMESPDDHQPYCCLCKMKLYAGKRELQRHSATKRHKKLFAESGIGLLKTDHQTHLQEESVLHEKMLIIDLRNDSNVAPTKEMKASMITAELGDNVYGEDSTVKRLEEKFVNMLGKEAALFVPTGVMANLICIMCHCWSRGSEVIMGRDSALNNDYLGALAQVANVHHCVLDNMMDGTFVLEHLKEVLENQDYEGSPSYVVCVENYHLSSGGRPLSLQWVQELSNVCKEYNVPLHMDAARLFNAAVALNVPPSQIVKECTSVAVCFEKDLGTPMGALVLGSHEFIKRAGKVSKMLGGSLHQAGIAAQACLYAVSNIAPTLAVNHKNARVIADCIVSEHLPYIQVDYSAVQSNVVVIHLDGITLDAKTFCSRLSMITEDEVQNLQHQIILLMTPVNDTTVICVTHSLFNQDEISAITNKLKYILSDLSHINILSEIQ